MTSASPLRSNNPAILSYSQERLWFLYQMNPESPLYNRPALYRLSGLIDIKALEKAINLVVKRHNVLRTTFPVVDGQPHAVTNPELFIPLTILPTLDGKSSEETDWKEVQRLAQMPFNLSSGPLLRAYLLPVSPEESLLLIVFHHIVFDGWSSGILQRELGELYSSLVRKETDLREDPKIQYSDYAHWQRLIIESDKSEKQLSFWKQKLTNIPVLKLPADDHPSSSVRNDRAHCVSFQIPNELTRSLRALAREANSTLYIVLLAAFKILLHRISGQEDIIVGSPTAGRRRTDVENLIGCFINVLVLRSDLSGSPTFRELVKRIRQTCLEAFSNQDIPFEKLVQTLQPDRQIASSPLFQVLFQLRNYPKASEIPNGFQIEELRFKQSYSDYDLTLDLVESKEGIEGLLLGRVDRFSRATVEEFSRQFTLLLHKVIGSPDESISDYSLITQYATHLLPDPRNPIEFPFHESVIRIIARCVEEDPDRIAIKYDGRYWTHGELLERSEELAHELIHFGINPGDVVAVTGPKSFGVVVGLVASLLCGATILPVDAQLPEQRKRTLLDLAGARLCLVISDPLNLKRNEDWLAGINTLSLTTHGNTPERKTIPCYPLPEIDPESPAYIFFTSGSTGTPKGILGTHKSLSHFLSWEREAFSIQKADRCANLTLLSFDVVLRDIFLPLTSRGTLCIPPKDLAPSDVISWLASEKINTLHIVPSIARLILADTDPEQLVAGVPSLKRVLFAGEPLVDKFVNEWRERLSFSGVIANLYGPTETTLAKFCYIVPHEIRSGIQPVGYALPNTQALVLSKQNRLCGLNEAGEIVIRTPFRTRGYIVEDEAARGRFYKNPFSKYPDDILYRTGDVGRYLSDGTLLVEGRIDNQLKINGVRIEPDEIAAILDKHPGVRACVIVAHPDNRGITRLVAYVIPEQDTDITLEEIRSMLAMRLPSVMIPSVFILLEEFPLLPNGKIDRKNLPVPEWDIRTSKEEYVAPRTTMEEELARIWSEILDLDRISVEENFFNLGGHSLLILRASSRIQNQLGVELSPRVFFESPTIAEMARLIDQKRNERAPVDQIMELLDEIENLSDEEIRALLDRESL